ncbi:MAG: T9SS type A sorting domain-containing protein [Ferruginibacter sp.]
MNNNSTQQKVRASLKRDSYLPKKAAAFLALLLLICGRSIAQNTDLPNPDANLKTAPAGSIIIAMDNTNQGNAGIFNLKAYGLVVTCMNNYTRVRWVIKAGKNKDDIDITVPAVSVTNPTVVTATSKITLTAGSNIGNITNVVGTLQVGMKVTATGIPAGTTIQSINTTSSQIILSANATSNQTNKDAAYAIDTYPVSTYNFKAGPFIIFPADTLGVRAIINAFNNAQAAAGKVKVYATTSATTVDVRYDMYGLKPKIAIVDDGGNAPIHVAYLANASVPVANYNVIPSASGLTLGCYTFASEPHNGTQGAFIDSIKSYVSLGGNFLAQCHAITTYENWVNGHFQTTAGFINTNVNITPNINYQNNDLSFAQFEGNFDANISGNTQTWAFLPGSTPANNFFPVISGATAGQEGQYGASVSKMVSGRGGLVYFLGNHDFNSTSVIERINGQRMYLNAMLTPSATVACPTLPLLPVQLKYFTARKMSNGQVQINWATSMEQNAREFIIERSSDGIHFTTLTSVAARGNSSTEITYNAYDVNPLKGRNFYRMQQKDIDGAKIYSNIVMINMSITNASVDIFPNPAHGVANVNLNNLPLNNNNIAVFDLTGKAVINLSGITGNTVKLNIAALQAGTYFVKVSTEDGNIFQQKMTVIN